LRGGSEKSAVDELQRPRQIAKFASEAVRAEWEALREEAKGTPSRRAASGPVTVTKKGSRMAAAVFGVVVLAAGLSAGVAVWRHRHSSIPSTPPAAAQPQPARVADTYLEVNASPWATVLKIQNGAGKSIDLRSSDHVTPFRLDGVPPASYEVTLKGPGDGQEQVIHCEINAQQHLCTADLGTPDTQQILTGERP
jgi:serine/threonine-protein kinase